jgi:hypothetical protein
MTFPTVAALAVPLEPELAIAYPPVASAMAATPAAIDAVSLRGFRMSCFSATSVRSLGCESGVDLTVRRGGNSGV